MALAVVAVQRAEDAPRDAALMRNAKVRRFLETGLRGVDAFERWADERGYAVSDFDIDSLFAQRSRRARGLGPFRLVMKRP